MPKTSPLASLIPHIDWNISNIDNARKLISIALDQNIKVSIDTITRFVSNQRRMSKLSVVPKLVPKETPAVKESPDIALETFDSIVETIFALRKYVTETLEENARLRERIRKIKGELDE